jgi:O-antigen/teichoic acid export membrane protein
VVSGVVFWVLAARLYTPVQIGMASAFLAPSTFLSVAFLLGANHGILRFSHQIEKNPRLLFSVLWFGAIAGALGGGLGIVICMDARWVDPLAGSIPISVLAYIILVSSGTIWTIVEAALVSLRAPWRVYIRSLIFALARITVLIPFAFLGEMGLVLAFSLSMGIASIVSVDLLRRQLKPTRSDFFGLTHPMLKEVLSFALPNHVVTLIATIPGMVLPILGLRLLGAEINGYFSLAWTVASMIRMVLTAGSSSLLAEGARNPDLLGIRIHRSMNFLLVLTGLLALPMVLIPRIVMIPFGGNYAEANAIALPLFALSILPSVGIIVFIARERIYNRIRYILLYSVANCILSIGLAAVGIQLGGYTGFSIGYLVSQIVLGAAFFPGLIPGKKKGEGIIQEETATVSNA